MSVVVDLPTPFGTVRVELKCLAYNQVLDNGSAAASVSASPQLLTEADGPTGTVDVPAGTAALKRPLTGEVQDSEEVPPPAKIQSRLCVQCAKNFRPAKDFYIHCSWVCRNIYQMNLASAKQAAAKTAVPDPVLE